MTAVATSSFLRSVRVRLAHPCCNTYCSLLECVQSVLDIVVSSMCRHACILQAILLKPEEKLDSMSCLAYMAPFSSALMLLLCVILEPASLVLLWKLPFEDSALVSALLLNCLAAFASNYFNMVVTKRTSALTIQVCTSVLVAVARICDRLRTLVHLSSLVAQAHKLMLLYLGVISTVLRLHTVANVMDGLFALESATFVVCSSTI